MSNVRLYFKYSAIRDDGDFLCLTDMWRAAEAPESKRPNDWLATEAGHEFAQFIADSQDAAIDGILRREHGNPKAGEGGSTWAHWQLGMAYAKYLSPAFHAWCNDVVRKVMAGQQLAAAPSGVTELREELRALTANVAALWGHISQGGYIARARYEALRADWQALADVEVAVGRWATRRAALADIQRDMREATGWGGKGKPWSELPANVEPAARAVLKRRHQDATRKQKPRQLSLLTKTG